MTDEKADERSSMWAGELDDQDAENATDTEDTQSAWDVESIRDSWNPNSVRLPDDLQRRFAARYSRLESDLLMADVDREFKKDRHYKPLVIALGLSALDDMDTVDVVDALDNLEQQGHLD